MKVMKKNTEENIFHSFDSFKSKFDIPEAHWAIDVYTPPDAGYLKVHNWACQLHTRGYLLGRMSEFMCQTFRAELLDAGEPANHLAAFIVPTGTAANALSRAAVLDQNKSIILCSESSHQADREAGSVEALTGSRALKPSDIFTSEEMRGNTYIDIDRLKEGLARREDRYLNQTPWMISLSCPAEDGTIPEEKYILKVAQFANDNKMLFHMDGARLFVAAGAAKKSIKQMTVDMGVDIFTLGGSKVGLIGVDAVVFTQHFFKKYPQLHHYKNADECFDQFRAVLKRIGALSGRTEEGAAQFAYAMTDGYGTYIGRKAYDNAVSLGRNVSTIKGISLDLPVQTNVVCIKMTREAYESFIKKKYPYLKVLKKSADGWVVRFQASHATTSDDIRQVVKLLQEAASRCPL